MTPTPSKPEASLRDALDLARALPCRCLSVAQLGERDPGCDRCQLVTILAALSARDEAGADYADELRNDPFGDELLEPTPPASSEPKGHQPPPDDIGPYPASGEAGADCAHKFVGNGHLCIRCGHDFATPPAASGDAETLARLFHDTYERLAPSFGYETRKDTRAFDPTSANGRLMIAVCAEIRRLAAVAPAGMVLVPRQTVEVAIKRLRLGVESPQTADLLADHLYLAAAPQENDHAG